MLGKNKRIIGVLAVMAAALFLFMASTNPRDLPITLLVLPLVGSFLILVSVGLVCMRLLNILQEPENKIRRVGYSGVIAGLPVGILLLRSINQLTVKDVGLITLLVGVSLIYVGRLRFSKKIE